MQILVQKYLQEIKLVCLKRYCLGYLLTKLIFILYCIYTSITISLAISSIYSSVWQNLVAIRKWNTAALKTVQWKTN